MRAHRPVWQNVLRRLRGEFQTTTSPALDVPLLDAEEIALLAQRAYAMTAIWRQQT